MRVCVSWYCRTLVTSFKNYFIAERRDVCPNINLSRWCVTHVENICPEIATFSQLYAYRDTTQTKQMLNLLLLGDFCLQWYTDEFEKKTNCRSVARYGPRTGLPAQEVNKTCYRARVCLKITRTVRDFVLYIYTRVNLCICTRAFYKITMCVYVYAP